VKVKVKISVAVDQDGAWNASGWGLPQQQHDLNSSKNIVLEGLSDIRRLYCIEAELDTPELEHVIATVTEVKS
jgi:hypothetical protein